MTGSVGIVRLGAVGSERGDVTGEREGSRSPPPSAWPSYCTTCSPSDGGTLRPSLLRRGAGDVASQAIAFARYAEAAHAALVNGIPGVVAVAEGQVLSVMAFTFRDGRITALDILTDPERPARIDLSVLDGRSTPSG
ncbi:hypothetical protein ACH4XT_29100 [Streptomyces avidinii]|uniref:hypothetical protein n=1 Tax=Streptomyces avidinii TaxID=1895 RepID=UPI00378B3858